MERFKTVEDVHNHAKKAVGKTVYELNGFQTIKQTKSSVGDAFENWFGKKKDSSSKPDMEEAGVELKATPFKQLKNGTYSAKERLVFNIINYHDIAKETFEDSHFMFKNKRIELAFYEYLKDTPKDEWTIHETVLYEMSKNPKDYEIIKNDWEKITDYVKQGKAHELSESLTNYLSPCTKGKNASSVRSQPFSEIEAKQRAYSLKGSYMTSILRKYIFGDETVESIVRNPFDLKEKDIETIVLERFAPYIGKSIPQLKEQFGIKGQSYQTNYRIAAAILDLKAKYKDGEAFRNVEEFEKASIMVKTIKFNEKNVNKESMSFPAFNFKDLVNEKWVNDEGEPEAEWHNFLFDTRFLFFVVKTIDEVDYFKGVKFFSVPEEDLQGPIRNVWEDTVKKLNEGIELKSVKWGDGRRILNNFMKKSDDMICHVRPHETKSDYSENGRYSDQLPVKIKWTDKPDSSSYSSQWMTKQSFWLNNDYIKKQVLGLLD